MYTEFKDKENIKNKFLSEKWMNLEGGIWTNLENEKKQQVTLMTKSFQEIENEAQMTLQYIYLNAIVLFDPSNKYSTSINS